MNIDCHYHLEQRIQPVANLINKMDAAGIDKTALMPTMWDVPPHTPEFSMKLFRFLLYHRFSRPIAKVMAAKFSPDGDIILPKATVKIYPDPDNAEVAAAMAAHPDRFLGWIFVNPRGKNDPVAEFDRWKDTKGFVGVKAHPFWHRFEPRQLMPVAEKAAAAGMPLLLHIGFQTDGNFIPLVEALPELKLILAHAGFPAFADTWDIIRDYPNIYLDLSAEAYVNGRITRRAVETMGTDRCLFGTDGPYGRTAQDGLFDNGFIKRRIESLFPNRAVLDKLLGGNFLALIDQS